MDTATFKCKKCRRILFTSERTTTSCTRNVSDENLTICEGAHKDMYVWYLRDDNLEGWMEEQVNQGNWIKGKLFCPTCSIRLGSYDFISGSQCSCGNVLPAIHVVKAKVDCEQKSEIAAIQSKIHIPFTTSTHPVETVKPLTSNCQATSSGLMQVISSSSYPLILPNATSKNELKDTNLIIENAENRQYSGGVLIEGDI